MVTDRDVKIGSLVGSFPVVVTFAPAINQADTEQFEWTIPASFPVCEVIDVQLYALTVTATVSADVTLNGTTCLTGAITPVAGASTAGVLSATRSARRIKPGQALRVRATTNGTGAVTNGRMSILLRAYPAATE